MPLTPETYTGALVGLAEVLPRAKTLSPAGLAVAWTTLDPRARDELTPSHLHYAVAQRLMDPEPRETQAIHSQLLGYLYPLVRGVPCTSRGLLPDLDQRMARPHAFHPPLEDRPEYRIARPRLPEVRKVAETTEQRRIRLSRLARQTDVVIPESLAASAR